MTLLFKLAILFVTYSDYISGAARPLPISLAARLVLIPSRETRYGWQDEKLTFLCLFLPPSQHLPEIFQRTSPLDINRQHESTSTGEQKRCRSGPTFLRLTDFIRDRRKQKCQSKG